MSSIAKYNSAIRLWPAFAAVCAMLVVLLIMAGCESLGGAIAATDQQAQQFVETSRAEADAKRVEAEQVAISDPAKAESLNKEADKIDELIEAIRKGKAKIVVDPSTGGVDVDKTVSGLGAMLPFPYNLAVFGVLGAWNVFAEYRSNRNKKAAVSIVKSVDTVIDHAPGGKETFKNMPDGVRNQVRENLTPHAKQLIEEVSTT